MFLQQLKIRNFRNYEKLDLSLDKNINIFFGNNAQGKTNILESVHFIALSKSHRTNNDLEMLMEGKKSFKVCANMHKNNIKYNLEIDYKDNKKHLFIDNDEYFKLNEYLSHLNIIIFYPDDIDIIKGLPDSRRKFLNNELSQLYPVYLKVLNEYNKLLKMKNDLLRKLNNREKIDMSYFNIVNEYLVDKAIFIYRARKKFIDKINNNIESIFYDISKRKGFYLKYITKPNIDDFDSNSLKSYLKEHIANSFKEEVNAGMALYGPHRDDFEFILDEKSLRKYGSQGQQKLSVLALKLSEINIFENQLGEKPVLLLDDIFSEFDKKKKNLILKYINNDIQSIITTTDLNNISKETLSKSKIFNVDNGIVKEIKR